MPSVTMVMKVAETQGNKGGHGTQSWWGLTGMGGRI